MSDIKLPESIENIVSGKTYYINDIGMSGSEVRIYDEYVLKIQSHKPETDNEYEAVKWAQGRLPVPDIPVYCIEDGIAFTLMTKVKGDMLCSKSYLKNPEALIEKTSEAIRMLSGLDITDCPVKASRLSERLKAAEFNVRNGLVDIENLEPETIGPDGFASVEELLSWLKDNRPEEDLVFTHGDLSLPNILMDNGRISGFIDLGKMGPADRWQDIAIAIKSLTNNLNGKYSHGEKLYDFTPEMLTEKLNIPFDREKYRYYILLDELF